MTTPKSKWIPLSSLCTALEGAISMKTLLRRVEDGTIKTAKRWGPKMWKILRTEFEDICRNGLPYYCDKKTAPKQL